MPGVVESLSLPQFRAPSKSDESEREATDATHETGGVIGGLSSGVYIEVFALSGVCAATACTFAGQNACAVCDRISGRWGANRRKWRLKSKNLSSAHAGF